MPLSIDDKKVRDSLTSTSEENRQNYCSWDSGSPGRGRRGLLRTPYHLILFWKTLVSGLYIAR